MFSKKVTKIGEIFIIDLTLCSKCQIDGEDFVTFVAFLENMNFTYMAFPADYGSHNNIFVQLTSISRFVLFCQDKGPIWSRLLLFNLTLVNIDPSVQKCVLLIIFFCCWLRFVQLILNIYSIWLNKKRMNKAVREIKGDFFSESDIRFSNLQISKKIFQSLSWAWHLNKLFWLFTVMGQNFKL